ncbi:MAG: hypothetical protein WD894_22285, partial [Pirellulales bacterium]
MPEFEEAAAKPPSAAGIDRFSLDQSLAADDSLSKQIPKSPPVTVAQATPRFLWTPAWQANFER